MRLVAVVTTALHLPLPCPTNSTSVAGRADFHAFTVLPSGFESATCCTLLSEPEVRHRPCLYSTLTSCTSFSPSALALQHSALALQPRPLPSLPRQLCSIQPLPSRTQPCHSLLLQSAFTFSQSALSHPSFSQSPLPQPSPCHNLLPCILLLHPSPLHSFSTIKTCWVRLPCKSYFLFYNEGFWKHLRDRLPPRIPNRGNHFILCP